MKNIPYSIKCRYFYVPTYYVGLTDSMKKVQDIVLDFKKGKYGDNAKEWFADRIIELVGHNSGEWVVSFVPASNLDNYYTRFIKLFHYLCDTLPYYKTLYGLVMLDKDKVQSSTDKSIRITKDNILVRQEDIAGKNIILIDDVITSGNTFTAAAQALEAHRAKSVHGLFFAKTIHPSYLGKKAMKKPKTFFDEQMESVVNDLMEHYDTETWNRLQDIPFA